MKGQFTWDYIVSIVAFIVLVSYISLQTVGAIPGVSNRIRGEFLRSEAYQISELLVDNPGEPASWTLANVKRVGLANESYNLTNYISLTKVTNLQSLCGNYNSLAGNLSIDTKNYNVSILIFNITGSVPQLMASCAPPAGIARVVNVTLNRFAAIDRGGYVRMIVQAW